MNNENTITMKFDTNGEPKQYQNVYITLEDGTVGLFSGPAFITDANKVVGVSFSQPKDLPDGQTWNDLWQTQ